MTICRIFSPEDMASKHRAIKTRRIPLFEPTLQGREWNYVKECLDSGWLSYLGPFVGRFEEAVASFMGGGYAVATNSGTAALHLALLAAGIEPDDEIIVPDLTFIAPVNAIRYCGAHPILMDVEPDYWQLDPAKTERFLEKECTRRGNTLVNKTSGRRIRALLPVHLLGHPCHMDRFLAMAKRYKLLVIEDAAESLGATYKGEAVGSIGDIGCISFNGNKIITTGGGGMVLSANKRCAHYVKYLAAQARDSTSEYFHDAVGYNYRLSNIQAAVGVAQMETLKEYVQLKRRIAKRYEKALRSVSGLTLPEQARWARSTYWLYTVLVDPDRFGMGSRELRDALEKQHIQTRPLWAPIHRQRPYRQCQTYQIEIAERLYRTALSLPCSVSLSEKDQDHVIEILTDLGQSPAKRKAS